MAPQRAFDDSKRRMYMKKAMTFLLAMLFGLPCMMSADNYPQLWKQVADAEKKDLPRTQIRLLQQIAGKAETAADYGQLLKASLRENELWASISADSVASVIARTESKAKSLELRNPAVAAVYYTVLGSYYKNTWELRQTDKGKAETFFAKAMENPALLAQTRATDFEPFVVKGRDSQIFDHDLLSLIGYQCEAYEAMHNYYKTTPNRAAALLTAVEMLRKQAEENRQIHVRQLKKSRYAAQLDSLINIYSDIKACGEAAVERFNFMQNCTDVTPADCYNYATWAVNKWGEWPTINQLRNSLKSMTQPMFTVNTDNAMFMADAPFKLGMQIRNYNTLTVNITKTDLGGGANYQPLNDAWLKSMAKHKIQGTTTTLTYNNVGRPEYETAKDSLLCKGLPVGVYMIDAWADNNKNSMQSWFLYVTDLYVAHQSLPNNKVRFVVLNAKTGQPVAGATLVARWDDSSKNTLKCDAKGETIANEARYRYCEFRAYTPKDDAMPYSNARSYFYYSNRSKVVEHGKLYTDRGIYRPGQTVHASLVAYSRNGDETKAIAGKDVTIILRNANYKTVEEKQVVTDSLGNASADFALPTTGLTGFFGLSVKGFSGSATSFRVEEYKRPTFIVELPEVNQKYQNGDTLVVTGYAKTYSGVPAQGATVKYNVTRNQAFWWRSPFKANDPDTDEGLLMTQNTQTDSLGAFKMELPMVLPEWETISSDDTKHNLRRIGMFYTITANVQVTDVTGETRTAEMTVPLGSKPTSLTVEMPTLSVRDSLKTLRFNYCNMAGKDISGIISYTIDGSSKTYQAEANKTLPIEWNTAALLKSGLHTLKAVCGTDTISQDFTLFSINDTVPCVETHDWFYVSDRQFHNDGSPVYLQIGSSDKDVHVLYTALAGDKVIDCGSLDLTNSVKTKALTYDEKYGDGLLLSFAWMKNGELYTHSCSIAKAQPDKRLNMKWLTFRDRTTPGAREEWSLNITKPDGTPADATLMATLYDASLDQIIPFTWNFNVAFPRYIPSSSWVRCDASGCYLRYSAKQRNFNDTELLFSSMDYDSNLDMQGLRRYRKTMALRSRSAGGSEGVLLSATEESAQPTLYESKTVVAKHAAVEAATANATVFDSVENTESEATDSGTADTLSTANVQLRENLNETAYFTPALRTDAKGNVVMTFTLPESITTWRLLGIAHDASMNNGSISGKTVAKKTVMIQPNMPRFVRSGDKATISARLFNTSENTVSGTAVIQLINPETEAIVMEKKTPFKVDGNGTGSVSFTWQASDAHSLLICKVMAVGKSFSDGEQHYLPILPDKEMIVNTVPFTQAGAGVQEVDLKSLFAKGATHKHLTVEYTNNPSWLVMQALPYIGTTRDNDIISLTTALYANTLGSYIVGLAPQLKTVFEQWKREPDSKGGSLASALTKNEELKTLVLDETPWVAEAETEAEQKRSLSNFFDINMLQSRNTQIIANMKKLQQADGSWSWWPGMGCSPYLTMTVSRYLARLQKLTGNILEAKSMLDAAQTYIGMQAVKEYEEAKKQEKKYGSGTVSESFALNYLYINALTGRKPTEKEATAAQYMLAKLKKEDAHTSLYTKALMAVVLAQNGETQLASQYLQSLEEYTVTTETMGRYYDTQRAGYSWCDYRIPTQVAAIEAMTLIDSEKYKNTITEMQRWLLQQKHTQSWSTPIQSADAVYAFINGNTAALQSRPEATLKVDGRQIETSTATAAIGYVKATVNAEKAAKLIVEKRSEGTSWGAAYAQSMQKTADIEAAQSGFSITRELLAADGKPAKALSIGDRVKVRITIKTDRAYDFVIVKDNRAACMEPAEQLSGYRNGCYRAPKDNATCYYFDRMSKGTHTVETDYYVDRAGVYETGICSVQCAYSPEFTARTASMTLEIK